MQKRGDYQSWDKTLMDMAFVVAGRSKDPRTQVGAVIVSQDNRPISWGYNGAPPKINDDQMPWASRREEEDPLKTKYPYVIHAEANAIYNCTRNSRASLIGAKFFVTHFPCNECAKAIAAVEASEVVYAIDYDYPLIPASLDIFKMSGITLRKMDGYSGHAPGA